MSSVRLRNTRSSLSIETKNALFEEHVYLKQNLVGLTSTASEGLNWPVNMKKDNNRNATSHIAVISTLVLPRFILALPMNFLFIN